MITVTFVPCVFVSEEDIPFILNVNEILSIVPVVSNSNEFRRKCCTIGLLNGGSAVVIGTLEEIGNKLSEVRVLNK